MAELKRLALTLGEPAGIGPDLCCQLAQEALPAEIVVVGSPSLLQERAKRLNLKLKLSAFDPHAAPRANGKGTLNIVPIELNAPCTPGKLDPKNASYVLNTLDTAFSLCQTQQCDALVTGPVHKALLHQVDPLFSGHTDYFKRLAKVPSTLMVFYSPELIVALATTHCPLKEVNLHLSIPSLTHTLKLLHQGLREVFGIPSPLIRICGLNPHAGEGGLLGKEEELILIPAIQSLASEKMRIEGPFPADTLFSPNNRTQADAILAMYHDQGLAPIKALYFNQLVNVTLGLPFLRTSVDHGTALDLAGTNKASSNSLRHAIHAAQRFAFKAKALA